MDVLREYQQTPLLMPDELGAEARRDGSPWSGEQLFAIINCRYDNFLPTVVTSNKTPSALRLHLGEHGERIVWRVVEMDAHGPYVLGFENLANLRSTARDDMRQTLECTAAAS